MVLIEPLELLDYTVKQAFEDQFNSRNSVIVTAIFNIVFLCKWYILHSLIANKLIYFYTINIKFDVACLIFPDPTPFTFS